VVVTPVTVTIGLVAPVVEVVKLETADTKALWYAAETWLVPITTDVSVSKTVVLADTTSPLSTEQQSEGHTGGWWLQFTVHHWLVYWGQRAT